ncbi:leucine-rich repeat protein SHOC-2-like, partial [Lineus longissimus]|uniref:leucine-rich repeat protein SHOC-2-like n=1 Tax=Lineus longissimus TaxID=88925 RepID=UPI00315D77A8
MLKFYSVANANGQASREPAPMKSILSTSVKTRRKNYSVRQPTVQIAPDDENLVKSQQEYVRRQLHLIRRWIKRTEGSKMSRRDPHYRTLPPPRSRPPLTSTPKHSRPPLASRSKSEPGWHAREWVESTTLRMKLVINERGMLELDLSDRKLYDIPKETFNFSRIQTLKICRNKISIVPSAIGQLRKLQIFDAHLNALMQVPDTICNCQHLYEMDLSSNKLRMLPPQIGLLRELKVLRLGRNQFEHLPSELGLLENLRTLDVQSNRLTMLPFTLENFKKLTSLNFSSNKIDIFPHQLCQVKSLQAIFARHNMLKSLPNDFQNLKLLRELNLQHNQMDSFPNVILALKNLAYLNLSQNRIKALPTLISKLAKLKNFHIEGNKMQSLTCNFESLENLNASDNHITNCALIQVKALKYLNLNNNQLENLPLGVCQLGNLEVLKLSRNRIQYLSKDVELLKNLQHFDISFNKLTKLPQVINELEKLEYFNVRGNKVVNQPILLEKVHLDNGNPRSSYVKHLIEKYNSERKGAKQSWWSRRGAKGENKSVQATVGVRDSSPVRRQYRRHRQQPQYHDSSTDTRTHKQEGTGWYDVRGISSEDTTPKRTAAILTTTRPARSGQRETPTRYRPLSDQPRQRPRSRGRTQTPFMRRKLVFKDDEDTVLSDGNWTLIPKDGDDTPDENGTRHITSSSDEEPVLSESVYTPVKPRDTVRTDFTLLGLCNQIESLLSQQLLKPVISHKGNFGRHSMSSLSPTSHPPITTETYHADWKIPDKIRDLRNGDVRGNLV